MRADLPLTSLSLGKTESRRGQFDCINLLTFDRESAAQERYFERTSGISSESGFRAVTKATMKYMSSIFPRIFFIARLGGGFIYKHQMYLC